MRTPYLLALASVLLHFAGAGICSADESSSNTAVNCGSIRTDAPAPQLPEIAPISLNALEQQCTGSDIHQALDYLDQTPRPGYYGPSNTGYATYKYYQNVYKNPAALRDLCLENLPETQRTPKNIEAFLGYPAIFRDVTDSDGKTIQVWCAVGNESFRKKYTVEQTVALIEWFGAKSWGINQISREGGSGAHCITPIVQALEKTVKSLPKVQGTVYRGSSTLPANVIDGYSAGKVVNLDSFMSTSSSKETATEFFDPNGGWFFIIHLNAGRCSDLSGFISGEHEVLCMPGTRFQIQSRDSKTRVIEMTELK